MVKLYSMLREYSRAVKLSLATNNREEAKKLANRAPTALARKQLWLMIASELLVDELGVVSDPNAFKLKLREFLGFLLTSQESCLTIEDILPLLPK